jgi:hypothetical protein
LHPQVERFFRLRRTLARRLAGFLIHVLPAGDVLIDLRLEQADRRGRDRATSLCTDLRELGALLGIPDIRNAIVACTARRSGCTWRRHHARGHQRRDRGRTEQRSREHSTAA